MTRIDIISDPICPWCYIGKAQLDRALESRPENDFEIRWHPFLLNPDMPAEGMARDSYLQAKFGGREGVLEVYGQIMRAADEAGLGLRFDLIRRTPSSIDAHRLIRWAGLWGVQDAVVEALFGAYFREGLDISDPELLVAIAAAAGMEGDVVARLLAGDADRDAVHAGARQARERGVRGVPCFIVAERHVVQGAQPASLWQQVIDERAGAAPGG